MALEKEDIKDHFAASIDRAASDGEEWTGTYNVDGTDINLKAKPQSSEDRH